MHPATQHSAIPGIVLLIAMAAPVAQIVLGPVEVWGQQVTDSEIKRSLEQALQRNFRLREADIQVSTLMGTATLKGTVDSYLDRHIAEQIAKRTVGVRSVVNNIHVDSAARRDQEIAEDVRRRISQSSFIRPVELDVRVAGGIVAITGAVPSWPQSRHAEMVAREVRGVRLVRNNLTVRAFSPAVAQTDEEIRSNVEAELRRDAYLSGLPIKVSVKEGVVRLEGEVPNLFHREHAGEEARMVANAKNLAGAIENQLVVVSQQMLERMPQRPSDAELQRIVEEELKADPRIAATQIDAAVNGGQVTLVGVVASMFERAAAERTARGTVGVTRVENHLTVIAAGRSDAAIEADILFNLRSDSLLGGQPLVVKVREAAVALSGEVKDHSSKFHAARIVARVRGVRSITNEVKVRWNTTTNDDAVRTRIEDRLRSNGITRPIASRVRVTVQKGYVTLAGGVDRSAELNEVERIARFTDGVRTVSNALTIGAVPPAATRR